ncbi:MAG: HAMP domain-containing histidine kinase [Lachnospiraceae bacterium]|nr:HAMP domain-containing histidine kinase [Lachnospiraceae bacterium]
MKDREKASFADILNGYLKRQRYALLWYGLSVGTLLSISFLYHQMGAAIQYSVLIITFFGAMFGMRSFFEFKRKVKQIEKARMNLSEARVILPYFNGRVEEEYQKLIHAMEEKITAFESEVSTHSLEQDTYYTMWIHQIKTPISAMHLLLQDTVSEGDDVILSQQTRKELDQELFKIEQYAEMALQYQRMQTIHRDLEFKECKVRSLVMKVVKKYSVLFIHKNIGVEIADMDDIVLTDEKWFLFLLEQVLSNALKYTKAGGKIRFFVKDQALCVQDTGIGIQKEDLSRIFERGFTGFNGRMFQKATGIGLFLCKQVADELAHTLVIESAVGVGTTVKIGLQRTKLELF